MTETLPTSNRTVISNMPDGMCPEGDEICVVRRHESEVIIVPVLLLGVTCIVGACIFWMICRQRKQGTGEDSTGPAERAGSEGPMRAFPVNGIAGTVTPDLREYEVPRDRLTGGLVLLGQGTFGPIYQGRLSPCGAQKERVVILKELEDPSRTQEFLSRVKFHALLGSHPNLVEFAGSCTDRSPLYLLLAHMNRGCLLNFLWTCRKDVITVGDSPYDLTERQVYKIGAQLAQGLSYLHGQDLVHGDIAARNVLIDEGFRVRLTGFRIPFEIQTLGTASSHRTVPLKWQAPERLMSKPLQPQSDIWSFGVLLYELVTLGAPPYPEVAPSSILQYLQRGRRMGQPPNCKSPLYALMRDCWNWRPGSRPRLEELRQDLQGHQERGSDSVVLRVSSRIDPETYRDMAGTWGVGLGPEYTAL